MLRSVIRSTALSVIALTALLSWGDRHVAHAYSNGAPEGACGSLVPNHGPPPQTGPSLYNVTVSSSEVRPSGTVTVTISGDDFKGFMVAAYSSDFPVGAMVPTDDKTKAMCNGLAITHTNPLTKSTVSFNWQAPEDLLEGTLIDFVSTVVKERVVFWVGIGQAQPVVGVVPPADLPQSPTGGGGMGAGGGTGNGIQPAPGNQPAPNPSGSGSGGNPFSGTSNSADNNQFPGHLPVDPQCGKSKACFHDCEGSQCTFIISWENLNDDDVFMSMVYRVPDSNEHWIALGFSKDQEMGDDSVTECIMHNGEVKIQQSFNHGIENKYLDNRKAALSEQTGVLENGLLHCSFHRRKSYPRDPSVFDLHNKYYLMVAVGEALNGNKIPHNFDVLPPVTDHMIDVRTLEDLAGEEPTTSVLVQAHGALMIISWLTLTSIGITTAKYGKPMFPKINPCGANLWFQIHRSCMLLVTLLTVLGILLMAVQCQGYCQVLTPDIIPQLPGKSHWPLHPPLGILVLILAIANPIMAFFRPGPKAPNRFIFNWSHWGVGVLSWIMSSLAIFIGLDLERAHAPPEAMYAMVAWGVYHIVFLVVMEVLPRPLSKCYNVVSEKTVQRGRVYNLERAHQDNLGYAAEDGAPEEQGHSANTVNTAVTQKKDKPGDKKELTREELKVQRTLLMVHYAIVFIFTFALLLVVYLYTPPHAHVHM